MNSWSSRSRHRKWVTFSTVRISGLNYQPEFSESFLLTREWGPAIGIVCIEWNPRSTKGMKGFRALRFLFPSVLISSASITESTPKRTLAS